MGVHQTDVWTMLKPKEEWRPGLTRDGLIEEMDKLLSENVAGVKFGFSQPIEMRVNELVAGVKSDVAVLIYGPDLDVLRQKAAEVERVIARVPGANDIKVPSAGRLPMLTHQRPTRPARALRNQGVGRARRGRGPRRHDGRHGLRGSDSPSASRSACRRPGATTPSGSARSGSSTRWAEPIPLKDLADITIEEGPSEVERENIQRRVYVGANVRGRDLAGFVADAKAAIEAEVDFPLGLSRAMGRPVRAPRIGDRAG